MSFIFFDENGFAQTGWQTVEGEEYYFNPETGAMVRDQVLRIDEIIYEFDSDGHGNEANTETRDDKYLNK